MIFADSGYFVALWNDDDPFHDQAKVIERRLRDIGWAKGLRDLITCLPMAWEVAEGISHGKGAVEGASAYAKVINGCNVIRPTERDVQLAFDRTFRLYVNLPRKGRRPGMIDSIGVAIMRRCNVLRLVSFDHGFDLVPDIRRIKLLGTGPDATLSESQ
jgi:predicted nucleic acid-binding protein